MSDQSEHATAGRTFAAVLGSILLLAEIPIRLMEHHHFLNMVETNFPQVYAYLISPSATLVRWIVGGLMVLWVIVEFWRQRTNLRPVEQHAAPSPQTTINVSPVIQNI